MLSVWHGSQCVTAVNGKGDNVKKADGGWRKSEPGGEKI